MSRMGRPVPVSSPWRSASSWVVTATLACLACEAESPSGAGPGPAVILDAVPFNGDASADAAAAVPGDARPAQTVLWVDPSRPAGESSDGTRARPFSRLEVAFTHARAGDVVALLPGLHPPLASDGRGPPAGVEVLGSDRDASRLAGPVRLSAAGAALRHLTVDGGEPGVRVEGDVRLEELVVSGTAGVGLEVHGGDVRVEDVRIADAAEVGFWINGGVVTGRGVEIAGARGGGLRVSAGEVDLSSVAVRDVALDVAGTRGAGVEVEGGTARFAGVRVDAVADRAVRVARSGRAVVSALSIFGPALDGLTILAGGSAEVDGYRVAGARNVGVVVSEASARLTGGVVSGGGRAAVLVSESAVAVNGLVVEDPPARGVALLASEGELSGLTVRRAGDVGLQITDPRGPVTLEDGHFEACAGAGVAVSGGAEQVVHLARVTTTGSVSGEGALAEGLHVHRGRVVAESFVARANIGAGILIEAGDLELSTAELSGNGGPGLVAVESGPEDVLRLTDVRVTENTGAGVLVIGGIARTTRLHASGTRLDGDGTADGLALTAGAVGVSEADRLDGNAGNGLSVSAGAAVTARSLTSTENAAFGVYTQCGAAEAALLDAIDLAGNGQGERNACP